jgi:hypothetical protein
MVHQPYWAKRAPFPLYHMTCCAPHDRNQSLGNSFAAVLQGNLPSLGQKRCVGHVPGDLSHAYQ